MERAVLLVVVVADGAKAEADASIRTEMALKSFIFASIVC